MSKDKKSKKAKLKKARRKVAKLEAMIDGAETGQVDSRKSKAASSPVAEAITRSLVEAVDVVEPVELGEPPRGAVTAEALADLLRVGDGFRLSSADPGATPGFDGGKKSGQQASAVAAVELSQWQERLYAAARGDDKRSLLLIVQGLDTSGKGGIMRHVVGTMDPQGVRITAFKVPTAEEKKRGYLWRIRQALPGPGQVGVFDRSQYEDVLVARVHNLVPKVAWMRRYQGINTFERETVSSGTTIVKVMLHISYEQQRQRLAERIERPDKYWKYNPRDIDERMRWNDYQAAYEDALTNCSTSDAPWFVVPADHKWYARWAVGQLMLAAFRRMDPQWPPADFDPAEEAARLAAT